MRYELVPHTSLYLIRACTSSYYTFGSIGIVCMIAKNYGKSEQSPLECMYKATELLHGDPIIYKSWSEIIETAIRLPHFKTLKSQQI